MQIPPTCSLDEAAIRDQKARYERLARSVTSVRRETDALVVEFNARLDLEILGQVMAVERECCPFFRFAFDPRLRRLRITVDDEATVPALGAIGDAFG